ncbi:MAG: carbonic anhydrase family protein [Bacteroidia bacterium]|nr:carbonic anhydrase family protein [Bacteroidia bacterium]MBP7261555.1 carbonic anhydrase family protein [Bacteroidia bacterium]MBP9179040.1 carbonic anhydrase family protein [Bacteroidia bacterium]
MKPKLLFILLFCGLMPLIGRAQIDTSALYTLTNADFGPQLPLGVSPIAYSLPISLTSTNDSIVFWKFIPLGKGKYRIINNYDRYGAGYSLDAANPSGQAKAIFMKPSSDAVTQQWTINLSYDSSSFYFTNTYQSNTVYMCVSSNDKKQGGVLSASATFGDKTVYWKLNKIGACQTGVCGVTATGAGVLGALSNQQAESIVGYGVKYRLKGSTSWNKSTRMIGTKYFNKALSGLSPQTTYEARAYFFISLNGVKQTIEGNTVSFTTGNVPCKWGYDNAPFWSVIGYPDCGGERQSPVAVADGSVSKKNSSAIVFKYTTRNLKLSDDGHGLSLIGDTNINNSISINGTTYYFIAAHVHTHSEHSVNGVFYPMEIHMVHLDTKTSKLAVVSVMVDSLNKITHTSGFLRNAFAVWSKKSSDGEAKDTLFNLSALLPEDVGTSTSKYYTYSGSLTTPGCNEIVQFYLLKSHITADSGILEEFASKSHNNFRPIQPLNRRIIISSE